MAALLTCLNTPINRPTALKLLPCPPTPPSCLRSQDILHSFYIARKTSPGLKTCDGHQELLKYMRSDVLEVASRLQKGGLGYMEDTSEFEEKVSGRAARESRQSSRSNRCSYGDGSFIRLNFNCL